MFIDKFKHLVSLKFWIFALCCCHFGIYSYASLSIEEEMGSYLSLGDQRSAFLLTKQLQNDTKLSLPIQEALIRTYAKKGDIQEALSHWNTFPDTEEKLKRNLLEEIAWGVLRELKYSNQFYVANALIAFVVNSPSSECVELIQHFMHSSNQFIRSLAIHMIGKLHDRCLVEDLLQLFPKEKTLTVRREIIQTFGHLKKEETLPLLHEIISSEDYVLEEKLAAIQSMIHITGAVSKEKLQQLAKSTQRGPRILAAQYIGFIGKEEEGDLLIDLLGDASSDVRLFALNACMLYDHFHKWQNPLFEKIGLLKKDPDPLIALTAHFFFASFGKESHHYFLLQSLHHPNHSIRHLAAYLIGKLGKQAKKMHKYFLEKTYDPYVQVNFALGLIEADYKRETALQLIDRFQTTTKETIIWHESENPLFSVIEKNKIPHAAVHKQYPEMVDQLSRLELLNVLAIFDYPEAQNRMKDFLRVNIHGVTYITLSLLTKEGDRDIFDITYSLLEEENPKIRAQAALVLALYSQDDRIRKVLEESFTFVERDLKFMILSALGTMGNPQAIPFLVSVLNSPYQVVQAASASALLQCLNH